MTILGVLGEADKLTESERDRVTEIVIETAGANFPICVGTTHAGTDGCIAYSRRAQQLGARAVMVAPCKLARNNDAALERHYLAVAEAIDIPVVVQDFPPAVGGITMGVELIAKLAAASPRLAFLKLEDDPAPMKITQIRAISREVKIFGGLGGMMFLEELRHGAIGTMTGFAFPEILVEIYTQVHGRRSRRRHQRVLQVPADHPVREPAAHQSGAAQAHLSSAGRDRLVSRAVAVHPG